MPEIVKGRVSILVPCYNGEQYIQRCLDSIINQTWKDIELIIVNDGSIDSTDAIIENDRMRIEKHFSRFVYLKQNNLGPGAAINKALKYFTGEYLTLLDCDDYIMPEALEVKALWLNNHPDTAVVQNNGYFVTENTVDDLSHKFCNVCDILENIPLFDWIIDGLAYNWAGSYMIRTSSWLSRFPTREIYSSRSGQNFQILLPAAYENKCDYIPDCLMKYIRHTNSLSQTNSCSIEQCVQNMIAYQDIGINVVKSVCKEEEFQKYKRRLTITFTRNILNLGFDQRDMVIIKKYYKKLKDLHGETLDDKINYFRVINPIYHYILRAYRKVISILQ